MPNKHIVYCDPMRGALTGTVESVDNYGWYNVKLDKPYKLITQTVTHLRLHPSWCKPLS